MILLDRLFAQGMRFVFQQLANVADQELDDTPRLREALLDAQMRLELGEIDEAEFVELERDLLARLRVLREEELGLASTSVADAGAIEVQISSALDED